MLFDRNIPKGKLDSGEPDGRLKSVLARDDLTGEMQYTEPVKNPQHKYSQSFEDSEISECAIRNELSLLLEKKETYSSIPIRQGFSELTRGVGYIPKEGKSTSSTESESTYSPDLDESLLSLSGEKDTFFYTPNHRINDISDELRAAGWGGKAFLSYYIFKLMNALPNNQIYSLTPTNLNYALAFVAGAYILAKTPKISDLCGMLKDKIAKATTVRKTDKGLLKILNPYKNFFRLILIDPNVDKALGGGLLASAFFHYGLRDRLYSDALSYPSINNNFHAASGIATGIYVGLKQKVRRFKESLKDHIAYSYAWAATKAAAIITPIVFTLEFLQNKFTNRDISYFVDYGPPFGVREYVYPGKELSFTDLLKETLHSVDVRNTAIFTALTTIAVYKYMKIRKLSK